MTLNALNEVVVLVLRILSFVFLTLLTSNAALVLSISAVCLLDKSSFNAFISSAVNCDAVSDNVDGDDMFSLKLKEVGEKRRFDSWR